MVDSTGAATVLADTEAPLRDFEAQAIDGGYILSGMGDSGMMAYIYDSSLSLNKEIAVDELLQGDFVVSETGGVAASIDGKKLALNSHHIGASAARDGHSCFLRMCMIHKVMY